MTPIYAFIALCALSIAFAIRWHLRSKRKPTTGPLNRTAYDAPTFRDGDVVAMAEPNIMDQAGYVVPPSTRGLVLSVDGSVCTVDFERGPDDRLPRTVQVGMRHIKPYVAPPKRISSAADIDAAIERGRPDGTPWTATQVLVLRVWRHACRVEDKLPTYANFRVATGQVDRKPYGEPADERRLRGIFGGYLPYFKAALP